MRSMAIQSLICDPEEDDPGTPFQGRIAAGGSPAPPQVPVERRRQIRGMTTKAWR
jgi:hypothetical protein